MNRHNSALLGAVGGILGTLVLILGFLCIISIPTPQAPHVYPLSALYESVPYMSHNFSFGRSEGLAAGWALYEDREVVLDTNNRPLTELKGRVREVANIHQGWLGRPLLKNPHIRAAVPHSKSIRSVVADLYRFDNGVILECNGSVCVLSWKAISDWEDQGGPDIGFPLQDVI